MNKFLKDLQIAETERSILMKIVDLSYGDLESFGELPAYSKGNKFLSSALVKLNSILWSINYEDLRSEEALNSESYNLKEKCKIHY